VYSSITTFLFAGCVETNSGVCADTAKAANKPKTDNTIFFIFLMFYGFELRKYAFLMN
jgi:hypothetical protein